MSVPKKIFIVPYRNRHTHRLNFVNRMNEYLKEETHWEIYFAHQYDERPFNRGAMKNIGFIAAKKKYPKDYGDITFIFHDVDTWPVTNGLINYDTTDGIVKHYYGYEFALGGMFSIKGKEFEKTLGASSSKKFIYGEKKLHEKFFYVSFQRVSSSKRKEYVRKYFFFVDKKVAVMTILSFQMPRRSTYSLFESFIKKIS